MSDKHISQVAFCALNAANLRDWYQSAFGMVKSGQILSAPPMQTDRIQGISPNPIEKISWLVDQQDYFQLEFFQYYRPKSKPKPVDWRPCDIGYNMVGIFARDFDKVVNQIAAVSDQALPAPVGEAGDRRVCLQDPEGNWLEVMERDPMTQIEGADPCIVRPELLKPATPLSMPWACLSLKISSYTPRNMKPCGGWKAHGQKPPCCAAGTFWWNWWSIKTMSPNLDQRVTRFAIRAL
jgi:hypothetical protein